MPEKKKRTVGGLSTRAVRTRVRLAMSVDVDGVEHSGRMKRSDAERIVIDYLLDNPQLLRDNLRVTLRLGEQTEAEDGER
jgi:hypothetical protein